MRSSSARVIPAIALVIGIGWLGLGPRGQADDCPDRCPEDRKCPIGDSWAQCKAQQVPGTLVWNCNVKQSREYLTGRFYQTGDTVNWILSPNDGIPPMQEVAGPVLDCYKQWSCLLLNTNPPTCIFDKSPPGIPIAVGQYGTLNCEQCPDPG